MPFDLKNVAMDGLGKCPAYTDIIPLLPIRTNYLGISTEISWSYNQSEKKKKKMKYPRQKNHLLNVTGFKSFGDETVCTPLKTL